MCPLPIDYSLPLNDFDSNDDAININLSLLFGSPSASLWDSTSYECTARRACFAPG
jgi:hypothetical protein